MTIQWVTGFFDIPVPVFEAGRDFWLGVAGYALSSPRARGLTSRRWCPARVMRTCGYSGSTLARAAATWTSTPRSGHSWRRGPAGWGTAVLAEEGLVVFRSPGGLAFCVSGEDGGPVRPPAARWSGESVSRVDQFCLDIPADAYDAECGFWADLTGWKLQDSPEAEFRHRRGSGQAPGAGRESLARRGRLDHHARPCRT